MGHQKENKDLKKLLGQKAYVSSCTMIYKIGECEETKGLGLDSGNYETGTRR